MSETRHGLSSPEGGPHGGEDTLLAPADASDPVIEAYKKNIDRTLLRENLKLTPEERAQKLLAVARFAKGLQEAGREARAFDSSWGLK